VRSTKHITPPKWDSPLTSQTSQQGYKQNEIGSTQEHMYTVCKQTYTHLITQDRQVGSTTYTKHMQGTKPTHAQGASNFQCKRVEYMLPQGGIMDIR
jgi:hypothetical protein